MKKIAIILTGKSGIGKTSTIEPFLKREFDLDIVSTGLVFKGLMGAALDPAYVLAGHAPRLYQADEALRYLWESGALARGEEIYERELKSSLTGFDICLWPEAGQRSIDPDAPAILAAKLASFTHRSTIIDTINFQECNALAYNLEAQKIPYVIVRLDCQDPITRRGDNRLLVKEEDCRRVGQFGPESIVTFRYGLSQLTDRLRSLRQQLATYLPATHL